LSARSANNPRDLIRKALLRQRFFYGGVLVSLE
jgi:hypothetical protein